MKQITDEKNHTEPQAVDPGLPSGTLWCDRGSTAGYWSSTWFSAHYARELVFGSGGVDPQIYDPRCLGFAIRPVFQKKNSR